MLARLTHFGRGAPGSRSCSASCFSARSLSDAAVAGAVSAALPRTMRLVLSDPPSEESTVTTRGHIRSIRAFKKVGFIDLCDGSTHRTLNVVFSDPQAVLSSAKLKVGQSIEVTGRWILSQGKQNHELKFDPDDGSHALTVVGDVPDLYPIQKKMATLPFLRTLPVLRHRTSTLASVLRFRSHVESELSAFFQQNDFVKVAPPLLTSSDCEGAGEQFSVKPLHEKTEEFFGTPAYLTVSAQLHLEVLALSLNRVWSLTPCFRAEDSDTNRHLSEFWMLEAEISHVTAIGQLTSFVESMVRAVVAALEKSRALEDLVSARFQPEEQALIASRVQSLKGSEPWPVITYDEAVDILGSQGAIQWGDAILTTQEKWLAGEHFKSPVFITNYPREQKPFYMPLTADTSPERATVACFDLILPEIGELVGGSLREHRHSELLREIERRGMSKEAMEWYLATRENGTVPHGGFGMGFERLLAYVAGIDNIRDISAFPRAPNECKC